MRQRNVIFVVLCATCTGLALLSTALNTALPSMAADLGVSSAQIQWVVSAYALVLAVAMPLTAYLVTRFPTRRLYLAALGLYLACTVVCALSSSFALTMAARVIQAAANGLISSLTQVTILSVFDEGERGSRMGWFGLSTGAAPVIAPALGGVVCDILSWRAVFWVVALVLAVSFIASLFVMRDCLQTAPKAFDVPSFVASVFAFGGITLGLSALTTSGLASANALVPLAVGLCAAVLFVRRQLASDEPFLKVQLLGSRGYAAGVLGSMALYAVMMGSAAVLPLYLQNDLGTTASVAGLVVLPGAALMALVSPVAGKIFDAVGIRVLSVLSTALLFASNAAMCIAPFANSLVCVVCATIVRYVAIGFIQMPLMTWANTIIPKGDIAHGSALVTSLRNAAGAVGVAVAAGLFNTFGVGPAYALLAVCAFALLPCAFVAKRV